MYVERVGYTVRLPNDRRTNKLFEYRLTLFCLALLYLLWCELPLHPSSLFFSSVAAGSFKKSLHSAELGELVMLSENAKSSSNGEMKGRPVVPVRSYMHLLNADVPSIVYAALNSSENNKDDMGWCL